MAMRRFRTILAATLALGALALGALALAPGAVFADSANHTYTLVAEAANIGVAPSGDTIHISCAAIEGVCGTFAVNPKSITASGEFEHFLPDGSLFASGTWTATQLISFHATAAAWSSASRSRRICVAEP